MPSTARGPICDRGIAVLAFRNQRLFDSFQPQNLGRNIRRLLSTILKRERIFPVVVGAQFGSHPLQDLIGTPTQQMGALAYGALPEIPCRAVQSCRGIVHPS
jgi:hypothetical protein